MDAYSLCHYIERTHGIVLPQTRGVDVGGGGEETYVVFFPQVLKLVACPEDGFLERANNSGRLRENFMYQNWKSNVVIIQEGTELLPRCDHCRIDMPEACLIKHIWTEI